MKVKGLILASIVLALLVSAAVFTSSSTTAMVVETESAIPAEQEQADPLLVGGCKCPSGPNFYDKLTDCWNCQHTSLPCETACNDPLDACLACCNGAQVCEQECRDTEDNCVSSCCPADE